MRILLLNFQEHHWAIEEDGSRTQGKLIVGDDNLVRFEPLEVQGPRSETGPEEPEAA